MILTIALLLTFYTCWFKHFKRRKLEYKRYIENCLNLLFFYIKMSYGHWKKSEWSVNNQKSSICKWDSWSKIFLFSCVVSKSFIGFKERVLVHFFLNVYFYLSFLFPFFISYFSGFQFFFLQQRFTFKGKQIQ